MNTVKTLTDAFQSGHVISRYFTLNFDIILKYSGPGLPFFLALVSYVFYLLLRRPVKAFLNKYGIKVKFWDYEFYEGFNPYLSNLVKVDKDWTTKEEEYTRNVFNYSTMPNATL